MNLKLTEFLYLDNRVSWKILKCADNLENLVCRNEYFVKVYIQNVFPITQISLRNKLLSH